MSEVSFKGCAQVSSWKRLEVVRLLITGLNSTSERSHFIPLETNLSEQLHSLEEELRPR